MTVISVIDIEEGVVASLSTFTKTKLEEAEELFKKIALDIDEDLSEDDLDDALSDGYYESTSDNKAVCITWSELQD